MNKDLIFTHGISAGTRDSLDVSVSEGKEPAEASSFLESSSELPRMGSSVKAGAWLGHKLFLIIKCKIYTHIVIRMPKETFGEALDDFKLPLSKHENTVELL